MNDEIEWLNSLEIPSCSLVTSIDDLKSGVVLCDLAAYLKSKPLFEDVHRHGLVQNNPKKSSINNFKIFLREIGARLPPSLLRTPDELSSDPDTLHEIVKFLKKLIKKPAIQESTQRYFQRDSSRLNNFQSSPENLTHRLHHSPSVLDIHRHKPNIQDNLKEGIKNWLIDLKLIKYDVVEELKDGVVLCELINRLEGRCEVIKGVNKFPKNKSAVQVNIAKALGYLRGIEKMEAKHLWSVADVMQGEEDTIFGILQNIKEFYLVKTNVSATRSARQLPSKFLSPIYSEIKPEPSNVRAWIINLGFSHYLINEKKHFLDDPCRNGILLGEVLSKLLGQDIPGIVHPKSLSSAQSNYERIFKILYEKYPKIAVKYLKNVDDFIEQDTLLWELFEELMAVPRVSQKLNEDLPYTHDQISSLKLSITNWINILASTSFESFEDSLPELSSGVLLSELIQKCNFALSGITKAPKTAKIRQSNIDKCLDSLRKSSRMSQHFLWKSSEISQSSPLIILGLLEDLHRYYDGLPARKRGPNYHADGPYLPKFNKTRISPLRNLSNLLNKSYESPRTCCSTRRVREISAPRQKFGKIDNLIDSNEFDWLFSFGINVDLSGECVEEFKSGVLLCSVVEKLERRVLNGVEKKVKSNAVALFNVGKAMRILKDKPGFPSSLMFADEEIVRGKGDVVRGVLRAVFKIYKQVIRTQVKLGNMDKSNLSFC